MGIADPSSRGLYFCTSRESRDLERASEDATYVFSPEAPLIIHDGELADVCQLLAELGLGFAEAPARVVDVSAYYGAGLVIASPQFLLERLDDPEAKHPVRVVVMTSEARTLRSILSRSGVEWFVRRPVHPSALRLFMLHCLYRGPNRRQNQRVSIGAEIPVRSGWRRRTLLLAEMSQRDCRFVTAHSFKIDQRIALRLPEKVTGGKPLSLTGRIVRIGDSNSDGMRDVCAIFEHPSTPEAKRIASTLERHEKGPAVFGGTITTPEPSLAEPEAAPALTDTSESSAAEALPAAAEEGKTGNRRAIPRHSFDRRVIALGDEAARVLLGRDISRYGMRVDPSPSLSLGSKVQIAIHTPHHATPLVLKALVDRDDGPRGLLLHFVDVEPEAVERLDQMLEPLPELADPTSDEQASDLIVSEIIEHDG